MAARSRGFKDASRPLAVQAAHDAGEKLRWGDARSLCPLSSPHAHFQHCEAPTCEGHSLSRDARIRVVRRHAQPLQRRTVSGEEQRNCNQRFSLCFSSRRDTRPFFSQAGFAFPARPARCELKKNRENTTAQPRPSPDLNSEYQLICHYFFVPKVKKKKIAYGHDPS